MAKLPFVVQPKRVSVVERVGSERCGVIEIERKGYLTAGEMAFVQMQNAGDNTTEGILRLVRKVSQKFKVDAQKAYAAVTTALTGKDDDTAVSRKVSEVYANELNEITQQLMSADQRRKYLCAYAMLVYRVASDFTMEEFMELDPELIEAIYEFFLKEEQQVVADLENEDEGEVEATTDLEELEKK